MTGSDQPLQIASQKRQGGRGVHDALKVGERSVLLTYSFMERSAKAVKALSQ